MNKYTLHENGKLLGIVQYQARKNRIILTSGNYQTCTNAILADSTNDNDLYQEDGLPQITVRQAREELA